MGFDFFGHGKSWNLKRQTYMNRDLSLTPRTCLGRWEEDRKDDGTKWKFLEHQGTMFAPPYEPLPDRIKLYYGGVEMKLSEGAEEVATFYARMLEHDYTTRDIFNSNFMKVR